MASKKITTLDGSTFLVASQTGDIVGDQDSVAGFFYKDMRHLSKWKLLINGAEPQNLSCDDIEYYASQHFLAPRTETIYENPYLSVARRRHGPRPLPCLRSGYSLGSRPGMASSRANLYCPGKSPTFMCMD
jgi:hypothetical protein